MSAKHGNGCEQYGAHHCHRRRLYRRLFAFFLTLLIIALLIILIIFLILRPTKPRFYLRDVSISQLKLNSYSSLDATLQVTLSSYNKNDRIGIYYDRLDVYADYKNLRITVPTGLPSGYQGHEDSVVWSPFLYGTDIPIPAYLAEALTQEQNAGLFLIDIKVQGRLRWKVGSWISGAYHIHVTCPAFLLVGKGYGNGDGDCKNQNCNWGMKFQGMTTCNVEV